MGDIDTFAKLELELRRGVLVLATLSQLRTPPTSVRAGVRVSF